MTRTVGVFGGTFDPPHIGHVNCVSLMMAKGLFDEIEVFPVNIHPYGKKPEASYIHRFEMTKIAFDHIRNVYVTSTQVCLSHETLKTEYSYDLLSFVRDVYNKDEDCEVVLLVGSDITESEIVEKWYKGRELLSDFRIMRFPRGVIPVSSTQLREHFAANKPQSTCPWLHSSVVKYIQTEGLYGVTEPFYCAPEIR